MLLLYLQGTKLLAPKCPLFGGSAVNPDLFIVISSSFNLPSSTQDSEKYVEELLALFNRFTEMVVKAFGSDHRFMTSRDKAYKHVVNDTSVFRLEIPSAKAR